jgi:hypothetical protein
MSYTDPETKVPGACVCGHSHEDHDPEARMNEDGDTKSCEHCWCDGYSDSGWPL